jgi:hypothetical protein
MRKRVTRNAAAGERVEQRDEAGTAGILSRLIVATAALPIADAGQCAQHPSGFTLAPQPQRDGEEGLRFLLRLVGNVYRAQPSERRRP